MVTVARKKRNSLPSAPAWIDVGAENCEHVVLYDVSWSFYLRVLEEVGERPLRLTYDGRNLEIMTVSRAHERAKTLLARMIEAMTYELEIPIAAGGSMTFKQDEAEKGLEPDECYWVANEAKVRGDRELDFAKDPPPDLAIEIEKSRAVLNRVAIYARLGVPELWKYDGRSITIMRLKQGQYLASEKSTAFPFLPVAELARFLVPDESRDDTSKLRDFTAWLRKQKFKP